ncbi:MAG: RluA family pseudouridine synthase [Bacilli bacterium]|nr:RluA family pseudouridine synthase [Bacilli bacterium]
MNKNKKRFEHRSKDYEGIREYKVTHECELLEFLYEIFKDSSKTSVKSLLSNHRVLVDGAPISQFNYKLYPDDVVMIAKTGIRQKARSNLPILFEDDEIIVINKPSGLLSVASDKEKGSTAFRIVSDYVQQKDKHNRIFVVHRIDEDTSGVLMFVKNSKLRDALQDKWNDLVIKRGYFAIIEGEMKEKSGTITSYLKKNSLNLMYSSFKKGDGQLAITKYKTLKTNDKYSLLDVEIETGRKNQIRVHLGEKGHNIIGDDKYGNPSNPLGRLGLHAYELKLTHPFTGKVLDFTTTMPKEFLALMDGTFIKKETNKKAKN